MDPKEDSFTDQVSRSAKVRTAISSKHAKTNHFRFSVFRLKNQVPSNENRFKITFWGHLSVSQDCLFGPVFKTVKKWLPVKLRAQNVAQKRGSALHSVIKVPKKVA